MSERRHLHPISTAASSTVPSRTEQPCSTVISCDDCALRETSACGDCVVTFVLKNDASRPIRFSSPELRAVSMLADAGLVPSLKHRQAG